MSLEVILEAATYLGIGVVTLVHTIDPGAVILGGAMNFGGHDAQVGRQFIERVREVFRSRAFDIVVKNTVIDYASLGRGCRLHWRSGHRASETRLSRGLRRVIECHHIRNFCIIAHIDHGKSTLADRLLEVTGTVDPRLMKDQLLDDMELERARGITIKARAVAMRYQQGQELFELNLIDTPGHVDFQYEVSRSLACCEGALLLVDAFQGVEAQIGRQRLCRDGTRSDDPSRHQQDRSQACPDRRSGGGDGTFARHRSERDRQGQRARPGWACRICCRPSATGFRRRRATPGGVLQAMVFDSHYDEFRGAITYVRIMNGRVTKGQRIRFLRGGTTHEVLEVGPVRAAQTPLRRTAGRPGRLPDLQHQVAGHGPHRRHGQHSGRQRPPSCCPATRLRSGWSTAACIPPTVRTSPNCARPWRRLSINDPSFDFEPETSDALGFGFRCGFLGLLHMEIIQQRLEQEADVDLVQTAPNVTYQVTTKKGETAGNPPAAGSARRGGN